MNVTKTRRKQLDKGPIGSDLARFFIAERNWKRMQTDVIVIPSFHFEIESRPHPNQDLSESAKVLDEIGAELVSTGFEVLPDSRDILRWYVADESYMTPCGFPTTAITTYSNGAPEIEIPRKDGTIEKIRCKKGYVTADLSVHNSGDIPPLMVAMLSEKTPIYSEATKLLFELTDRFPLVDNKDYRRYMYDFSKTAI
jgi:hypothetical protein